MYAQPLFGRLAGSSGYNASMGGFFALIVFTSPLFLPSRTFPLPWACGLPSSYLLGLPPPGSSFKRAVAAPLAFPVRRENSMFTFVNHVKKKF